MWQRTYDRHLNRYSELDARCGAAMAGVLGMLNARHTGG